MTLLGLDFDNTIVRYDSLFHQLAVEKGLISESFPCDKILIRDYLRSQGDDKEFTVLQGEVYGLRILEAEPADGLLESILHLKESGISMVIVSHKTKTPFNGPPYDLRKAALDWLDKYGFFSQEVIGWNSNQVFFENTKSLKAERICSLGCTHYVDDLPEILSILPDTIARILYDPNRVHNVRQYKSFSEWSSLSALITPDS